MISVGRMGFLGLCAALLSVMGGFDMPVWAQRALPVVVAHRGNSWQAPENTLPSYMEAWAIADVDGELDIHLTADGQVVMCHDANLKRTTGVDAEISKMTLEEIKKLDAGSWKSAKYAGTKVPTLDELLATLPADRRIFIEIKTGVEILPAFDACIARAIALGKKPEQMPIISFHDEVCAAVKKAHPELKVYWLSGFKQDKETKKWSPTVEQVIATAKKLGVDGVDLQAKEPILSVDAIAKLREAKMEIYTWTVDDAAVAKKLAEFKVDGITTNKPEFIKQQLGR